MARAREPAGESGAATEEAQVARIAAALSGNEPLGRARAALGPEASAWVVGGALRDAARGEAVTDIDIAVAGDARAAAREVARAAGGHAFELSSEFPAWRVAGPGWHLDLAELRAPTIGDDLRLRDFTVNAIAAPLAAPAASPPLDPLGGLVDLRAGLLRACSQRSFEDDPLRVLRAARIGAALGLELDAATAELARASAGRAAEPAGERQFAELAALIGGPRPLTGLELLDRLGATPVVLPELDALRGVGQSANHHLDAHGHTIEVLARMLEIEADLDRYCGAAAGLVGDLIAEPLAAGLSRREGLRFAALLHDIGKPATRTERDGWVSFVGHDKVGAEQVRALCRRLRTPRRFGEYVARITRDHLVLGFMVREMPLPPRRVFEYLERTGPQAVDTTLLTIADRLSSRGGAASEEAIAGHLELAREMLAVAARREAEGPPEPLLGGAEIAAELGIEPGPVIGEAIAELRAARFAGEVADREEAIAHLRGWLASR